MQATWNLKSLLLCASVPYVMACGSSNDKCSNPSLIDPNTVIVGCGKTLNFVPKELSVSVGTTVHWQWDGNGHNVVSGAFGTPDGKFCSPANTDCGNAPLFQQGATYDFKFTTAGTFPYYCMPHVQLGMTGTIKVQ